MSPMRLKTRVASFTWQDSPGHVPQSMSSPSFTTSQPSSKASTERSFGQVCRAIDRFTVATSATTRIDARGSDRCWRMITTSRSAWYIESVTKSRKTAASVPALSSSGSMANAPMRVGSQ